ncbi:hypothetical protein CSUI_010862 [Cystoisospora suis]|uniref:Transmembrane protein n=1 Tax=Cystoisospora suis TaxID=483139 RepID=A0A2C6KBT6_9APIC|nr:hypothetical protein CSUI_010862 [Cystoisospora suis]
MLNVLSRILHLSSLSSTSLLVDNEIILFSPFLSIYLSISISIYRYLSIYLSICIYVYLSIYLYPFISIRVCIFLVVCLSHSAIHDFLP